MAIDLVLVRLVPLLVEVHVIIPAELDVQHVHVRPVRTLQPLRPLTSSDPAGVRRAEVSPFLVAFMLRLALSGGVTASKSTLPPSKSGSSEGGEPGRPASFSRVF